MATCFGKPSGGVATGRAPSVLPAIRFSASLSFLFDNTRTIATTTPINAVATIPIQAALGTPRDFVAEGSRGGPDSTPPAEGPGAACGGHCWLRGRHRHELLAGLALDRRAGKLFGKRVVLTAGRTKKLDWHADWPGAQESAEVGGIPPLSKHTRIGATCMPGERLSIGLFD